MSKFLENVILTVILVICYYVGIANLIVGNYLIGAISVVFALGNAVYGIYINKQIEKEEYALVQLLEHQKWIKDVPKVEYDFDNLFNDLRKEKEND